MFLEEHVAAAAVRNSSPVYPHLYGLVEERAEEVSLEVSRTVEKEGLVCSRTGQKRWIDEEDVFN